MRASSLFYFALFPLHPLCLPHDEEKQKEIKKTCLFTSMPHFILCKTFSHPLSRLSSSQQHYEADRARISTPILCLDTLRPSLKSSFSGVTKLVGRGTRKGLHDCSPFPLPPATFQLLLFFSFFLICLFSLSLSSDLVSLFFSFYLNLPLPLAPALRLALALQIVQTSPHFENVPTP